YGSSTGFYGKKMFSAGSRDYLSAAVLYENMVVESYSAKYRQILEEPVVAIYPKEGTFMSDHPVAIVDRPWVGADEREAAEVYIQFLLAPPQQKKALTYGFRPGVAAIPLGAPIDPAHGVDPRQPKIILEPPDVPVMEECLSRWKEKKKASRVVLLV